MTAITLETIREARARIAPYVLRTPTVPRELLRATLGLPVVTKLELLQHAGSFKPRGAFNAMLSLNEAERAAGVVAVSGGNHALGVAYAARILGLKAVVVMPKATPQNYVAGTRAEGAEVVLVDDISAAFAEAERQGAAGRTMIHPFDDPRVIAGQGTMGLELLEDAPDTTDIIASIGGGGMISGVITAVKALRPDIRIWGVETEGADAMSQALAAGHPVRLPAITSISTTLGAPSVSERTLAIVRDAVEEVLVVPDADAVRGVQMLIEQAKVVTEPAAGCTLAAALRLKDRLPRDARLALILCGGNVTVNDIERWRGRFGIS
ncbi:MULTISPECIES: threonine ammonia-lyase [Inquilinus]|uniref:Threonine dehydratase n=1 Tax=Inquilinus ginsengisoli TaxID=363840 RepID=A0ABU1K1W4_9PROT|nr:threonine/serine dehydratase [Inquilinus ginsengisoli]MDR6294254.1 threonine dehydratase [Inquilinus ginsengisoli]